MPKLLTVVTLCMLACVGVWAHCGFGQHDEDDNDEDSDHEVHPDYHDSGHGIHPDYRNIMFHYVIMRGCSYTAGYVRAHFTSRYHPHMDHRQGNNPLHIRFVLDNTHEQSCDWKPWLHEMKEKYNVPHELANKLYDCGLSYSMMAFNVSDNHWAHCNHTDTLLTIDVGRRNTEQLSGSIQMVSQHDSNGHEEDMDHGWHENQQHSFTGEHIHSNRLKSWCKKFSCKILRQYHFSDKSYKHTSPYWLVDFYRMAEKYHMPKSYMYGLVGCGMEYALQAFNALHHNAAYT